MDKKKTKKEKPRGRKTRPEEQPVAGTAIAKKAEPASSRAIVPSDPLQRYLSMVRSIPPITEEEERHLAIQVYRHKDHEAALKLVSAYLNLVVSISFKFRNQFQNILDLIQEGNIGLMRAVEKFDPFRGVKLPTYASYWIRAYMLKYILDNWRLVRVGTTNMRRKLLFNLNKVTAELRAAGINPGPKQLAEHFKTTPEEIEEVQKTLTSSDVSFDSPLSDDSERTYAEVIGEERPAMDAALGEQELTELIKKHIAKFAERLKASDREILYERLMADDPVTLVDIGEKYGVTREAIRQAEARLKAKLKEYLEENIPGIGGFSFVDRK